MVIYVMHCCITDSIILLLCKIPDLWQEMGQTFEAGSLEGGLGTLCS